MPNSKRLHLDYNWRNLVNREFRLHSAGSDRLSQSLATPAPVNFDQMFRGVIEEFASQSDIQQRLVYHCTDPTCEILPDRKLIRQIINNLVSNALKYSPADKEVFGTIDYLEHTLVLSVRDQGIAFPRRV